ncbi:MAG: YkgJ family cysteine cluster protein [Nitrospirota bacterium]
MTNNELLALVPPALAEADAVARRSADRELSRGSSISCRKGCDACCRYLVRLSLPEVLHLRRVLEALPEPRRAEAWARFAAAREKLAEEDLLHDLETGLARGENDPGHDHRVETLARRYLALRIPCPFLVLEEGCCGIYPDRPAPCRQHLVSSPAELCRDPFTENVRLVPLQRNLRDELVRSAARITDGSEHVVPLVLI